ncbi:hypothetical protein [Paracoccus aminovorans]|uniref:hypothetical protein n=1 Tax=Paracoccus aminovorans TaxID=34004 RepID=UPI002B26366D|nr:hypothetical protein [Paracoccus aminovorans]
MVAAAILSEGDAQLFRLHAGRLRCRQAWGEQYRPRQRKGFMPQSRASGRALLPAQQVAEKRLATKEPGPKARRFASIRPTMPNLHVDPHPNPRRFRPAPFGSLPNTAGLPG